MKKFIYINTEANQAFLVEAQNLLACKEILIDYLVSEEILDEEDAREFIMGEEDEFQIYEVSKTFSQS